MRVVAFLLGGIMILLGILAGSSTPRGELL
jgi:hypothetical protein